MKVLCTVSLPPTSLKTLNRIQLSNNEELSKIANSSEDGLFLLRTRLRLRQQMLRSAIQKKEEEITKRRLEEMTRKQKREGTEVVIPRKKTRIVDKSVVEEQNMDQSEVVDENVKDVVTESVKAMPALNESENMDTHQIPLHQIQSPLNHPVHPVADTESQQECCPICGVPFSDDMNLTQRTRHVEKCLNHQQHPVSKSTPPPPPSDDELWEKESDHDRPRSQIDVRTTHGKRVLIDDGDDRFYRSLVYQYLLWREAERNSTKESQSYYDKYQEQASVMNEWTASGNIPSSTQLQAALKEYYQKEPAYLLASGCLIPRHLFDTLYPYQREGVRWILNLHQQQVGGILADEMGLGKTIQIVAALIALKFSWEAKCCGRDFQSSPRGDEGELDDQPATLNSLRLSSILVVPATLLGHWMRELRCWCPLLRAVVIHSLSETMTEGTSLSMILTQCRVKHRYDIVMTTYEGLRSSVLYQKQDWFYAILDEGGKIKNSKVTISQTCRRLRTVHRLLISGTPLQNNLKELWSLFDFVYPGRLGTQEAFVSTYVIPINKGIYSNASLQQSQLGYQMSLMLQDTINPFILRRLKRVFK